MQKPDKNIFYIFTERGSRENRYIPSGWMGDFGDIKFSGSYSTGCARGSSCIQIKYSAERKQEAGWCGIYWQNPSNNWGDKRSNGYNLADYKKLKFFARGEKGGELIDKFGFGGITGQAEEGDSDQSEIGPIELTKDWKEYEIPITKGMDLSHIIGGFVFAANAESNPQGFIIYLDEIRYEK